MAGFTNRGKKLPNDYFFRRQGSLPTNFYVALVKKKNEKSFDASAVTNEGSGKVGLPCTAHGYSAGARVKVEGTVNYNGFYLVDSASTANKIVVTATYVAETLTAVMKVHEAPGPRTNVMSDLVEITAGNGYSSGGMQLAPNTTDFDVLTEDDSLDKLIMQIKDIVNTASGGNMPASGDGARYAVLTDDNGTIGNRQVFCFWDLVSDRVVSVGQNLTLQNLEMQLAE